jgi:hypothetical protein
MQSSPVVELRQYTLRPGQRDTLITLFDERFVESQEDEGMTIIGQFRDLDREDMFVWVRGFPDTQTRARRLHNFYYGPVWKAYAGAANPTMLDSTNVLMLRPAAPDTAFDLSHAQRAATPGGHGEGIVEVTIVYLPSQALEPDALDYVDGHVIPQLIERDSAVLGLFVSESAPNEFPALPIREGEHVIVWVAGSPSMEVMRSSVDLATALTEVVEGTRRPEVLRLEPTSRSALTGVGVPCSRVANAH